VIPFKIPKSHPVGCVRYFWCNTKVGQKFQSAYLRYTSGGNVGNGNGSGSASSLCQTKAFPGWHGSAGSRQTHDL